MRKLLLLLFLTLLAPAYGAIALVNSVVCANVATCTTSWNVKAGNVLVIGRFGNGGGGTITDTQNNSYVGMQGLGTYGSNISAIAASLSAGGSTLTVNSTATELKMVLAEFSGVTLVAAATPTSYQAANSGGCYPPNITVTTNALLISIWGDNAGGQSSCTSSTGINLATTCGGQHTGKMNYQIVGPGTYSQTFIFNPGYNAGNAICGFSALQAVPDAANKIRHTIITGE